MAIKTLNLPTGETVEIDEWLDWPQFSTFEFGTNVAVNLRAFTYVQGQRVPQQGTITTGSRISNESDTNQVARKRMNHDEAYLVYSITYEAFALSNATLNGGAVLAMPAPGLNAQNMRRLQRDLVIELFVGASQTKPQARMPFSWVGQGPGAPAFTSGDEIANNIAVSYGTGGGLGPKSQRQYVLPIYIHSDRVMFLSAKAPSAISDLTQQVRLRWYLNGLKRRPVA